MGVLKGWELGEVAGKGTMQQCSIFCNLKLKEESHEEIGGSWDCKVGEAGSVDLTLTSNARGSGKAIIILYFCFSFLSNIGSDKVQLFWLE